MEYQQQRVVTRKGTTIKPDGETSTTMLLHSSLNKRHLHKVVCYTPVPVHTLINRFTTVTGTNWISRHGHFYIRRSDVDCRSASVLHKVASQLSG